MAPGSANVVAKIAVRVVPNTDDFRQATKRQVESALKGLKFKVKVDPDTSGFAKDVNDAASRAAKSASGKDVDFDTDLDDDGLKTKAKAAATAASGNKVRFRFDIKAFDVLQKRIKNFRQKYFQPDQTIGFVIAGIAAAIAPVAGLIGSLLAGLPTLLASVGAAAAVIALGFEGIKDAAKPLVAALEPLKASLSDVFRENLTPQFEKLASVLPAFQGNLEHIARGLTVFSGAFVDAFTSGDNVQKVNALLARTGNLFAQMAPGMASFTDGFLTMFEGASRGYPAMARVFNGFAELFKRDMSQLVDTGHMQAAMVSLAAVTGSLMTSLHRMFVAGIQVMPQMTKGFTDMFNGIANGIITALPALAKFSNAVGTGIGAAFEGLGKGIATLGNYLSTSSLGEGIGALIQSLAPALMTASSAVMEFIGVIGDKLGETLVALSPAIAAVASAFSDNLATILQELVPVIGPLITAIGSLVEVILEAAGILLSAFGPALQVVAILIAAIAPAIIEVIDWFARLLTATSEVWGPILVGIAAVITAMKIWSITTAIVIAVKGALTAAIGAVRTAMWFLNAAFYANPIGFIVTLVLAAVAAFIYLSTATDAGREAISRLNNDLSWLRNIITILMPGFGALIWLVGKFNDFMGNSSGAAESFSAELDSVTNSITGMTNGLAGIPTDMDFTNMGLPQLQTDLDGATGSALGLAGAIPSVDAALAQAGTTAETMSWHVQGIGDAAMGAVPTVQESTQLFSDAFLNMLPGMAEAERRVHEMGVNMGTNIAGVATAVPGAMAPFHEEMFGIPLSADTAMNETTAILGAGLAGFALTNPDFVGPIKMQFDEIPRAADTAMSNTTSALSTGIGDAASSVQTGLAPIPGHVTETGSQMTTEMTTAMTNMNTGLQTGVDNAGQIASTMVPTVKGAIGDTNALHSSGLALGNSFAQGIRDSIPAARAAAAELAAAVKANMPNSPAKEGPLSGKGYTDESGKALAKDFAGGIRSEVNSVSDAASSIADAAKQGVEQYHKEINRYNHDLIYMPAMEGNAKKIADYHKREAEAIERGNDDAEKALERRNRMLESLEVPDFRELNRSIQSYYIDGTKGLFNQAILKSVADNRFSDQLKNVALRAVDDAREHFGDHPVMAQVEANVNAEHFAWSIEEAIKAADLGAVPIDFAIANLDQLKSDLGFGNGAVTRGLQAVLDFNPNETDAYRYEKGKEEVHYHVTDLEEAMRMEDERRRRGALRYI